MGYRPDDDPKTAFVRALDKDKNPEIFVRMTPKPDACDHDFTGWRSLPNGGEQVCSKCGMGATAYSLRTST